MDSQKFSFRDNPAVRKINKAVLCILLPILLIALCFYIFLTPRSFPLENGYILVPISPEKDICTILCSGTTIVPAGKLAIQGKYPWVYGTSDQDEYKFFVINMKDGKTRFFSPKQSQDFMDFIEKNELPLYPLYTYSDLYPEPRNNRNDLARKQLKDRLSKPAPTHFGLY